MGTKTEREIMVTDVKVGKSLSIDDGRIVLTVLEKSGKLVKLSISTEKGITVSHGSGAPRAALAAKGGIRWSRTAAS